MASPPPVSPTTTTSTRSVSPTEPPRHLNRTTWSTEQEARLVYCQEQLKQAQKKWSDRQELWIREVESLLEIKRTHKKLQKKQDKARRQRRRKGSSSSRLVWKPLSRTQSCVVVGDRDEDGVDGVDGVGVGNDGVYGEDLVGDGEEEDDEEEDEEEESSLGEIKRSYSLPLRSTSLSSSFSTFSFSSPTSRSPTTTTNSTTRNPFKEIIRRMSGSSYNRGGMRGEGRVGSVVEE